MPPHPPPRPARCAEHSIFDDTYGIAPASGDGTVTLDLDEPTHKIVEIPVEEIEVVLDFDGETTQPIPFYDPACMPTHYSDLPAGMVHAGHFSTDGWVS